MVRRKKGFDRGDIVFVSFNPAMGSEQQGDRRPALVLSPREFNQLGMVFVAPITQGGNFARERGFSVTLSGSGTKTQGVILLNQCRMLDLEARQAIIEEKAPIEVVEDALARLQTIIE